MKIQVPLALSAIMSMANTMTGLRTPATDITFSGHSFIPQGTISCRMILQFDDLVKSSKRHLFRQGAANPTRMKIEVENNGRRAKTG